MQFQAISKDSINFSESPVRAYNYGAYIGASFYDSFFNETTTMVVYNRNYFLHDWNINSYTTGDKVMPLWGTTEQGLESVSTAIASEGLQLSYGFKCTNDNDADNNLCFYAGTDTDSYFGDTSAIMLGNSYDDPAVKIYFDGANLIFDTDLVNASSNARFSRNVSSTGYITRTSVYDKDNGDALDNIFDTDYYLTDGEIDHTKFLGYVQYPVNDPDNCWEEIYMTKYCYDFELPTNETDESGKQVFEFRSECYEEELTNQRTLDYVIDERVEEYTKTKCGTKMEEGVMLDTEVNLVKQGLTEYRSASDVWELENISSPILVTENGIATENIYTMSKEDKKNKTTKEIYKQLKDVDGFYNLDDSKNYSVFGDIAFKDKIKDVKKENGETVITWVDEDFIDFQLYVSNLRKFSVQMATEMCDKDKNKWSWCD